MADVLTSIQEPGFFSQVKESPELFLSPTTINIVGLIGTGSPTKAISDSLTRGATGVSDDLSNPLSSVDAVSSDAVFSYPASSYGFSITGSVPQPVGGFAGLSGTTLSVSVSGNAIDHVFSGGATMSITEVVDDINNDVGVTLYNAVATADDKLMLVSTDGLSIEMGAGSANSTLGFTEGQLASGIYWDPAQDNPDLAPQPGDSYKVDYQTPKVAADFLPQYFFGSRQVAGAYGDLTLDNSLVMGANAAFASGASVVVCRQLDPDMVAQGITGVKAEMQSALSDLENTSASIIVPMVPVTDDPSLIPYYLNHVSKMSSKLERKERIVILGVDERSAKLPVYGSGSWSELADYFQVSESSGLKPRRVLLMCPGKASITSTIGETLVADGTYISAALAGRMVSAEFDEATPMTRKTLPTIDSMVSPELTRAEKNVLTSLGITVVEMRGGVPTVRRAVTADTSSIAAQEPSIVRAFDKVAGEMRVALEDKFVGTKIVPLVNKDIEASAETLLNAYVASEIIGGFRNVKAVQNSVEPRQFDISFEAIPVFPFLWGFIDISIVLG